MNYDGADGLTFELGGTDVNLSGPTHLVSTNDDADSTGDGGRDVRYLVFDTTASDLAAGFVLSGDAMMDTQGDFPGSVEGVAFAISVE